MTRSAPRAMSRSSRKGRTHGHVTLSILAANSQVSSSSSAPTLLRSSMPFNTRKDSMEMKSTPCPRSHICLRRRIASLAVSLLPRPSR
eukprot:1070460-Prymnesium_polylepis.1